MKIKTTGTKNPTANLAINKSRIKKYGKKNSIPSYYLEKGQEFQIELFNPTQGKILTTIKLNNKAISGGLVLRPGERVFLDRFLETNKKFLFDTYKVDNTKSAKKAIEPNGDVEIAFFKEVEEIPFYNTSLWDSSWGTTNLGYCDSGPHTLNLNSSSDTTNNTDGTFTVTNTSSGSDNLSYDIDNLDQDMYIPIRGIANTDNQIQNESSNLSSSFLDSGQVGNIGLNHMKSKKTKSLMGRSGLPAPVPTQIETGRVEKGSNSKQDLREASGDFEMISFHVLKYKLIPKSQKKLTSVDYYSKYCTSCGGRCKTKFCPFCGEKQ